MAKDTTGRTRLKSFWPIHGVGIPNTNYKNVSLGGANIDMGADGNAYVRDIWVEGTAVFFTFRYRTPGVPDRTLCFLNTPGTAEPLEGSALEKHLAELAKDSK